MDVLRSGLQSIDNNLFESLLSDSHISDFLNNHEVASLLEEITVASSAADNSSFEDDEKSPPIGGLNGDLMNLVPVYFVSEPNANFELKTFFISPTFLSSFDAGDIAENDCGVETMYDVPALKVNKERKTSSSETSKKRPKRPVAESTELRKQRKRESDQKASMRFRQRKKNTKNCLQDELQNKKQVNKVLHENITALNNRLEKYINRFGLLF